MAIKIENEFAEEQRRRREQERIDRERTEFGKELLRIAQPFFGENLIFGITAAESQFTEYRIRKVIPKKGFFSLTRKPLVAQVRRNDYKGADWNLQIVVFDPGHEELAKALAAPYTMIYSGKIKVMIVHNPVSF